MPLLPHAYSVAREHSKATRLSGPATAVRLESGRRRQPCRAPNVRPESSHWETLKVAMTATLERTLKRDLVEESASRAKRANTLMARLLVRSARQENLR